VARVKLLRRVCNLLLLLRLHLNLKNNIKKAGPIAFGAAIREVIKNASTK
jgi:hypothetical protein